MPRSLFPSFLLPATSFRNRRKSSTDSASTQSSLPIDGVTGSCLISQPELYLKDHRSYLRCARCAVDLCLTSAIVSRGFTGRWGRAYLVAAPADHDPLSAGYSYSSSSKRDGGGIGGNGAELPALPNTHVHRPVPRQLVTGAHTVSDVSCAFCGSVLGWKYVHAEEDSQRYKIGKFILETKRVSVVADWEQNPAVSAEKEMPGPPLNLDNINIQSVSDVTGSSRNLDEDQVAFDSQDEEECEDLFAGVWTPANAARRRRSKRWEHEPGL